MRISGGETIRARHLILVMLIGAGASGANLFVPMRTYDGGLVGAASTFLLHGELPYRDFWWLYGPAAPWATAVATMVAGPSLLLLRVLGLALIGLQAGVAYALIRPSMSHVAAATIAIGATSGPAFLSGVEISAWGFGLTFAIAGLLVRVRMSDYQVVAGLLIGIAFAARLDVGAYALVAALVMPRRIPLLTGFVLVAAPASAAAILTTPFSELFSQVVWYPIVGPRQFRGLPLPSVDSIAAFVPFLTIVVIPKVTIAITGLQAAVGRDRRSILVVTGVFAALCQLQTLGRADFFHQAQAAYPGYLLLGLLGGGVMRRIDGPVTRARSTLRLVGFAAVAGATSLSIVVGALSVVVIERGPLSDEERELVAGVRTIQSNTKDDEAIFVGLTSHRVTLVNDMLAYYLADRPSGVRVAMFNPGVTNTDAVQTEMVSNLGASQTELLMLSDFWANVFEPANDSAILGSNVLDQYIRSHYQVVCDWGGVRILATPARAPRVACASERSDERLVDILTGLSPAE